MHQQSPARMRRIATLGFVCAVAATTQQAAFSQPAPTFPGFSCERLAKRQPLTGTPDTTFRVEKLTFTPHYAGSPHKHPGGEIIYLLSGNGSNVMNGKATPLSKSEAVYVPGGVFHDYQPSPGSTLTVLVVQFSDKAMHAYQPKKHDPIICKD